MRIILLATLRYAVLPKIYKLYTHLIRIPSVCVCLYRAAVCGDTATQVRCMIGTGTGAGRQRRLIKQGIWQHIPPGTDVSRSVAIARQKATKLELKMWRKFHVKRTSRRERAEGGAGGGEGSEPERAATTQPNIHL